MSESKFMPPGTPNQTQSTAKKNSFSPSREGILSVLNSSIETIDIVKELVPLELAKGVLSAVSGVLSMVKDTMQNKDDFAEVAKQCYEIGLVIWRATSGTPEDEISPAIIRAITELQRSVESIQEAVQAKAQSGIGARVFHREIDKDQIDAWQRELDRILQMFNTELHIMSNTKLDELILMFEEMRTNMPQNQAVPQRDPPPAKPSFFFGRDKLVHETADLLLNRQHVALIGPGGMGKSSVAKAVLHNEQIVEKYKDYRYFVRYDDMDASQLLFGTFLDRIATALGVKASKANRHSSVSRHLASNKMLLVLDNAETFLDAEKDSDRIANAIDEFGAFPTVTILMTTRSRALPPNLACTTLPVPALDRNPAREAFIAVYHTTISPDIVDKLLSALDFHPLSINLLAQAAVQNEWSAEELVESWEQRQTQLLQTGSGKIQSLTVTIELSLNSPSIKKLGDNARYFLQMVAFLPQGVEKKKLTSLFPSVSNIDSIADMLCKQSLTYRNGSRFTMLAPIRLYISSTYNGAVPHAIPLLAGVRDYYYAQLEGAPNAKEAAWICTEDVNVERLIALDLTVHESLAKSCGACCQFLLYLEWQKLRPTSLRSVVLALPEDEPKYTKFLCFTFNRQSVKATAQQLTLKGFCVYRLAEVERNIGHRTEAIELYGSAKQLFHRAGDKDMVGSCTQEMGDAYTVLGQFIVAEQVLKEAIKMAEASGNHDIEAERNLSLGMVMMFRGKKESLALMAKAQEYFESKDDQDSACNAMDCLGYAELFIGTSEAARRNFEAELAFYTSEGDKNGEASALIGLSGVDVREGGLSKARQELGRVRAIAKETRDIQLSGMALSLEAALATDEGHFTLARDQLAQALAESTFSSEDENDDMMNCIYISARNELYAQNYIKAKALFLQCSDLCDSLSDVRFKARCQRALGEIALRENDLHGASERFTKARFLADSMGTPPELLYLCFDCYSLGESFEGWGLFLKGRLLSA